MPKKSNPDKLRFYFEPLPVPENILTEYTDWQTVCVPVPVPLIPYLTPIMRIWQSPGCLVGSQSEIELFILLWTDLIARINTSGVCEDGFMLRQNPANVCQLQQSIDGGVSWFLAFDYSLCASNANTTNLFYQTSNLFQQWNNASSITEINNYAPTATYTSSTGESPERINARKLALCAACHDYVYFYCEAIKEINQDASVAGNLAFLVLGVAAAIAAIIAIPSGGSSLAAYMALSAAIGAAGVAAYSALTDAVLDDTVAKDSVACLMYNTLKDAEVTQENFRISLNSTTLSGNAELIRSTMSVDISNDAGIANQYHAFLNLIGDALRPAELGLIDDCLCFPDVLATPVIIPIDCFGTAGAGTSITDVGGGFWEITSQFLTSDYRVSIADVSGRDFLLSDVSFPDGLFSGCVQADLVVDGCYINGCSGTGYRYGEAMRDYVWTFFGVGRVRFRMVVSS
jgi:hypothetical protein